MLVLLRIMLLTADCATTIQRTTAKKGAGVLLSNFFVAEVGSGSRKSEVGSGSVSLANIACDLPNWRCLLELKHACWAQHSRIG